MRRLLSSVLVIAVLTISASGMCFASEVPAKLTIPADAVTRVDINVGLEDENGDVGGPDGSGANGILMTGSKGTPNLAVETLTVQNNNSIGKVRIDSVDAEGIKDASGDTWTLVKQDTDFTNMNVDQHKFSLVADGSHDMTNTYEVCREVLPKTKEAITFTGKTGPVTKPYSAVQVAKLVVTVSVV
jgi:hypothetical protein